MRKLFLFLIFALIVPMVSADVFKMDMTSPNTVSTVYNFINLTSYNETDPIWTADKANYALLTNLNWGNLSDIPTIFATNIGNITDWPATFTPAAHTHDADDIISGTLNFSRLPSLTNMLTLDWLNITNAPTIFATNWANISDVPSIFATNWGNITDVPATFAPAAHDQAASTITAGTFPDSYVVTGGFNVTENIVGETLIFDAGDNVCIFYNGTDIIINNNSSGVTCP